jgi:anti-sigma B factor antagonist
VASEGERDVSVDGVGQTAFSATTEQVNGVAVVRMTGELDMRTVEAATTELRASLDGNPRALVVDMSRLTFLASAGLAMLAAFTNDAGQASVALRLVADNRAVLRPLQITGLDAAFEIRATVDEALTDLP